MAAQISLGLDLGSSAIKVVKLERALANLPARVAVAATIPVPLGSTLSEATADRDMIAVRLKKVINDSHVVSNEVTVALPEPLVFTRVIEVPQLTDNELESALKWQADQYIPLPLSEVTTDYAILSKPDNNKEKMQVLLVAAPLSVIDRTKKMLAQANLEPIAIETEIIATLRSFTAQDNHQAVMMIMDCGASKTDFSIVESGILLFTHTTGLAGEAITRAISSAFNFERLQAEEYKKVYGLDESHFQGKVFMAIKPIVDSIVEELRKSIAFYQEKNAAKPVKTVILTGGTALLPGLVRYITNALSIEVQIGNPWSGLTLDQASILTLPANNYPLFSVATGLALRSLTQDQ